MKCVIIGSGLGGLSCGCILAKNGYDVTILEQGFKYGGCLQCFQRDGVVFDTGIHYIGSADTGQTLNSLMHYFNIDKQIKLKRLNQNAYDIISFRGEHFCFANGKEGFIETLAKSFPNHKDELEKYFDKVKLVANNSSVHSLSKNVDMSVNTEFQTKSINDVINGIISDPILQNVIAGTQPLYAGEINNTPFSTHALITDFYNQSAFRIVGGSSCVADALADSLKGMGGKILIRHKAEKIECDKSKATAVITSNGERFPADLVISTIHPTRTFELIDNNLIRPIFRKRMMELRNTTSSFVLYIKFKDKKVKYLNSNIYYYRNDSTWNLEKYNDQTWPKYLLYMHICHEENPEYAKAGEIITYMNFQDVAKWTGTKTGHRGEEYENFKKRMAEKMIDAMEEEIPHFRDNIECYYTSSPLTYLDYTGVPEGAMYGVARDIHTIGSERISCKTRIPNLMLSGQSTTLHGMLGVLAGSIVTCSSVLTSEKLFSQLDFNC